MDEQKPGKGRGALIAAALKKMREAKAVEDAAVSTEPPKPRGRAALLAQLKKKSPPPVGASSPNEKCPPQEPPTSAERVTEQIAELSVTKTPILYKGETGTTVPASANYILLQLEPGRGVFEYEVKFDPVVDSKAARCKMVHKLVDFCKAKTFDGHILYLPEKITDSHKEYKTQHPFSDEQIQVIIIYKKEKTMDECIHLYNVLFKRIMFILQFKRVGRQFFDNKQPFMIPQHKLEVWPGYVVSVNEFSGGIMLCLDVQHRVLRTQNALECITEIAHLNPQRYKQTVEKTFIGCVVLTRYNNKTYIIHDILWDRNPQNKFETSDGNSITFADYFKRQYNLTITDLEQPLLVNRQSVLRPGQTEKEDRLIMLIPELSYMTGLRDEMRQDFRVMKDIAMYTRVTPNQRMNSLRKFTASINNTQEAKDVLGAWGLSLQKATIDMQMRILNAEEILFGKDVVYHGSAEADWTSAAMKNPVIVSMDFRNWVVLHTAQDKRNTKEFIQCMIQLGPRMGIKINEPNVVCIRDDRNETYVEYLQKYINSSLQIICIICPTSRDDRYMTIKKICCSKAPIPSQVINSRTLKQPKKLPAITQKIALQMNCKLGGSLWSVRFPFRKWMVCGIDVFHSKTMTGQAVVGFVSSLNESMIKWYSRVCFHDNDKELSDHLKMLFMTALQEFYNCNSYYPEKVVIYRDGVGDGQMPTCLNFEVPQLLSVIKDLRVSIKLVFIVVQKRINARIFSMSRSGDVGNPPPGSIVDDCITRKYLYDFFLVSQQVRQGTVTPTHYVVLYDDANMKPDHIQRLTYKMCHMYYNWCGTVRVPAPCQYAHKLAYLIGQNVRTEHSASLAHTLFYL